MFIQHQSNLKTNENNDLTQATKTKKFDENVFSYTKCRG